jgi:hypothetical protein
MRSAISMLTAVLVLVLAAPASAVNFPVTRTDDPAPGSCDPGDCSLREAFAASEAAPGADTISVPPGTYRLTLSTLPTVTQNLTVSGTDPNSTVITGGAATGGNVTARAGAILHTGADLTLSKLSIQGNSASVTNPATQSVQRGAGGIVSDSTGVLTLVDTIVSGNANRAPATLGAGGVFATNLVLTNSRVEGNADSSPGGNQQIGGLGASTIAMTGSSVSGNAAGGSSTEVTGGIAVGTGSIENSTISGNVVAAGTVTIGVGGLENFRANVTNTTISGNTAASPNATILIGGLNASDVFVVRNSTIARNSARDIGNVRVPPGVTLASTIVSAGAPSNCSAGATSAGGNVEDGNTCGLNPALGDKPDTDPLLAPLAFNGGLTPTHGLAPGSPAIDAVPAGNPCPAADQRGVTRPVGARCDSGAFEFVPPAPANTALPAIAGTPAVGSTLTCQPGTWTGDPSFAFAWLRNGVPIAGAEASTYTLTKADMGTAIQCRVTGAGAGGQTVATSMPAVAQGIANRSRPAIRGNARVGNRVRCAPGRWTGAPAFAFSWLRNGKKISRASTKRYRIRSRDRGRALQCRVRASQAGVSASAESKPKVVGGRAPKRLGRA